MNILILDSWLKEYLETKATLKQIKEYLSLCGPTVERIHEAAGEPVYDVEITTNRPDAMSVVGIAREAAAILPRFGVSAKLVNDPYKAKSEIRNPKSEIRKKLDIKTDPALNPRWTSIVFDNVTVKPSSAWLKKKLEATGIRSVNNIVDITNYLMRCYGQPAHVFDYDFIGGHKMILRESRKGEKITTLDGKTFSLPGGDIVIEDGTGKLIDLCGIMGGQNSAIRDATKTVVLFLQTYDPARIRKTMMSLGQRTEAGSLFEKGIDPELILPAFYKGMELMKELGGGRAGGKIYDIYPNPYKPYQVFVSRDKADSYIGTHLSNEEIINILSPLGFQTQVTGENISVTVPSFRRDVTIDVDIIEELARIYGYHNINAGLPDAAPPAVTADPILDWEDEIKIRLRDWGYTEIYTYSMISEELMDIFGLDKNKAYKIANPLSSEWVYMRPHLFPGVLLALKQNMHLKDDLKLFELSMAYQYQPGNLPKEKLSLVVVWTGKKYLEAKGLAEEIFTLVGIPFPSWQRLKTSQPLGWYGDIQLPLGEFGSLGEVRRDILNKVDIDMPVTRLYLDIETLVKSASLTKRYVPILKYPASYEDLAFILPPRTLVGPILQTLKSSHPLAADAAILDRYENTTTFRITYQSSEKNLSAEDIRPAREKLISKLRGLGLELKSGSESGKSSIPD